ncbi:MAG: CDP-glucose 4,6-dehydratase [Bradyrhizobium sp.]|uniref:CDP-glucose 4,6-dehydratase n=1 Tax=Bradyrhizobium sp. TaxID=376 RepID=UPI001C28D70A|nr:CDP-glucose 4,6-dehydratase [Bradyrhizobium sp.]MBU6463644.1 CDP-glucose 4,6-dehydratase [Pseudomonadota bacterium]MDE2066371.1 CDP-glucose 4,6-dehydratase [Bradyrhizobium sp.]MDE2243681.1 CDP-glucose 4,6-dehydratase [Bradyrhizobium sp.]MDE2470577.1 CDP-glucose 4,6-dehydratase [Bradyrhizobium sp.]
MEALGMNPAFWKDKRVLVTGHTGFKGGWLVIWLRKMGAEVGGLALPPATTPNVFELAKVAQGITSMFGDIRDLQTVRSAFDRFKPDIVFHLAAQAIVLDSYQDPVGTYATNVMGTVHVFEAARTSSVRVVVNVTSDKCYDNREWVWPYREVDPVGGKDPYSSSKGCAELVTAAYRASFFQDDKLIGFASARAGNVIGGGDWAPHRLIPDVIAAICGGRPVPVRHPDSVRPWQHVLEPLSGYLLLAERLWDDPTLFSSEWNFGPDPDNVRSVRWLIDRIAAHWGIEPQQMPQPGPRLHEARLLALDSSKARAGLNWAPRWNLDRAAAAVVEWYKSYHVGAPMAPIMLDQINAFINTGQD